MEKDAFWFVFVLIALFFGPFNQGRYETSGIGSSVLVLDKSTGEAWVAVETYASGNAAKIVLTPVKYSNNSQWSFEQYTPEETRNDKNSEWSTWFKRKFFSKNTNDYEKKLKQYENDWKNN